MVVDLDTRLAEFDRKLRQIQEDLVPEHTPPAPQPVAPAEPLPEPPQPEAASPEPPTPAAHARGRSGPLAELLQHAPHTPPPPAPHTPPHEPQPAHEPRPQREPPKTPRTARLDELAHLLGSLHEVLAGIEGLVTQMAVEERPSHEATISAGPFRTVDEVREFERELAAVPGVREVTVRGYEGAANAIIDVHLGA